MKVESLEDRRYLCESSICIENNMVIVDLLIIMYYLCIKNFNIRFLNYWMINVSFIIKYELNIVFIFFGYVIGGEEFLLFVW